MHKSSRSNLVFSTGYKSTNGSDQSTFIICYFRANRARRTLGVSVALRLVGRDALRNSQVFLHPIKLTSTPSVFRCTSSRRAAQFIFRARHSQTVARRTVTGCFLTTPTKGCTVMIRSAGGVVKAVSVHPGTASHVTRVNCALGGTCHKGNCVARTNGLVATLTFRILGLRGIFTVRSVLGPTSKRIVGQVKVRPRNMLHERGIFGKHDYSVTCCKVLGSRCFRRT